MNALRRIAALGVALAAALLPVGALAAPRTVALLLGDLDSLAAVRAVAELRQEPALAPLRFEVLPTTALNEAARARLRAADLVLVNTIGEGLARSIAPELAALRERRVPVWAVGTTWNDRLQALGLQRDEALRRYMAEGGVTNVRELVRAALVRSLGFRLRLAPPEPVPEVAAFDPGSGRFHADPADYQRAYLERRPERRGRPWIAILFYRGSAVSGQTATVAAMARAIEARGANPLPGFGYPNERAVEQLLIDGEGRSRVDAVLALAMKIGTAPDKIVPVLRRLDVAVVNAITLNSMTRAEWEASVTGLDLTERAWQVAGAEFAGAVAPTVVASKEKRRDEATGIDYLEETPMPERVARAAGRVVRYALLRHKKPAERRVAVMYYNYPPGKENIGASYLNVLERSLWQMLERFGAEGYDASGRPATPEALFDLIKAQGSNINNSTPGALEAFVRGAKPVLLPVATYERWFAALPAPLREAVLARWGPPRENTVMAWRNARGEPHFVFPVLRWGNLLFGPQPTRGWEQDVKKLYHDVSLPPHHQYLAWYLWLQHEFKADAMVHVGTHATHEWQSGKEVGYTAWDPGEVFVGEVPQLYPYIMDDIGEGLQAKRRGMATLVSHLTPPLDVAGLNRELKALVAKIDDYVVARQRSEAAAAAHLTEINALAQKLGVLKDLGLAQVETEEQVEELEHHLKEIGEKLTPFGLHTFGVAPTEAMRQATARAVYSLDKDLAADERGRREAAMAAALDASGRAELDALMAGLAGRYVAAGPGNDPVRNPDAVPTGRNLYGFDPQRVPTPGTYAAGARLADDYLADWRRRHGGAWPRKLVFNLWGVETSRHEGLIEGEILALMGVRPQWDARGRVIGVELIPAVQLKRPRVDVTIVPSGLYRDLFAPVMLVLDKAVAAVHGARGEDAAQNPALAHSEATRAALQAQGVAPEDAERLAKVRLFSVPSGAYGTNLDKVVPLSNTWSSEQQVADVYFMRMSHPYGQGLWGALPEGAKAVQGLQVDLLRHALKGAQAAVHSRSSNVYATLDNDDFYQYLGGTAMAIRQVNGSTPEVGVVNLSSAKAPVHESLEKYMGRELRSRYVNPAWMEAMLKEGYAGGRFVSKVAEHLWGWQVTVPEAVDGAKWQQLAEAWVDDKYGLDIRNRLRAAKALDTYQTLIDRMLTAVKKGYWQPDAETVARLEQANREVIAEVGVLCTRDTCSSAEIVQLAAEQDARRMREALIRPAPVDAPPAGGRDARATAAPQPPRAATPPAVPPDPQPPSPVQGFEMETHTLRQAATPSAVRQLTEALVWLVAAALVALGFASRRATWLRATQPASG